MTQTIEFHDIMLRIVQDILCRLMKKKMPDCKGFIMFTVSKLDADPGPRTALLTNLKDYHSVKIMLELANQHMEVKHLTGSAERKEGEIWVRSQKTFKKD